MRLLGCALLLLGTLLPATTLGANTLIYKTIGSKTNIRRGAMKETLLHFSLTLSSNSDPSITVTQIGLVVNENPSGQFLFRNGHLFTVSGGSTNQIASTPPLGNGTLVFLLQDNLVFTKNEPREFLLKGDFLLDPAADNSLWTNTVVDLATSANGFTTTPPETLTLTNSDTGSSNIFHRIRVHDNLLNIQFTYPTPPGCPSLLERGDSHMIMGFTLSNVHFPITGEAFTVNNLILNMLPGENAFTRINIYQDNGDGTPDSSADTFLSTYTPDPMSTEHTNIIIPLSTPILVDGNNRLIWVEGVTDPNLVTANLYMELELRTWKTFAAQNKISLEPPYINHSSITYTNTDTESAR